MSKSDDEDPINADADAGASAGARVGPGVGPGAGAGAGAGAKGDTAGDRPGDAPGTGKVAGVPYDWRKPTVARLKSRWWNSNDNRIFTPKTYGWGYDVNLYEVGRRLRLLRR